MRLLKYLSYSPLPKEVNEFRAMSIKLVENPKDYSDVVSFIQNRYDEPKVQDLIERINKELKSVYKGKHSFALCLSEGILPSKIRIKRKYEKFIKKLFLESNQQLSQIKKSVEIKSS
jgi:hypothetical protein